MLKFTAPSRYIHTYMHTYDMHNTDMNKGHIVSWFTCSPDHYKHPHCRFQSQGGQHQCNRRGDTCRCMERGCRAWWPLDGSYWWDLWKQYVCCCMCNCVHVTLCVCVCVHVHRFVYSVNCIQFTTTFVYYRGACCKLSDQLTRNQTTTWNGLNQPYKVWVPKDCKSF